MPCKDTGQVLPHTNKNDVIYLKPLAEVSPDPSMP